MPRIPARVTATKTTAFDPAYAGPAKQFVATRIVREFPTRPSLCIVSMRVIVVVARNPSSQPIPKQPRPNNKKAFVHHAGLSTCNSTARTAGGTR